MPEQHDALELDSDIQLIPIFLYTEYNPANKKEPTHSYWLCPRMEPDWSQAEELYVVVRVSI